MSVGVHFEDMTATDGGNVVFAGAKNDPSIRGHTLKICILHFEDMTATAGGNVVFAGAKNAPSIRGHTLKICILHFEDTVHPWT